LIGSEGTRLLREDGTGGDPAGALAPRRLPGPPAESEVPGEEINRQIKSRKKGRKKFLLIITNKMFEFLDN
jgi:hypothetical protein